uniref:Uncharacterized protein n=1 Tax=Stegastes partitus TaxID=144197 RepID=A0A3B5BHZ2_9TELE
MLCLGGYSAYVGRCLLFFSLAILMDVIGLILFFVGVAAPLSFWDFFVFSGSVLIFLSLVFWIFWYLGNLEPKNMELRSEKGETWNPNLERHLYAEHLRPGSCSTIFWTWWATDQDSFEEEDRI